MRLVRGKLNKIDKQYKRYLEGKDLVILDIENQYLLLGICNEKNILNFSLYAWDNGDVGKDIYSSKDEFVFACIKGFEVFSFKYDEIDVMKTQNIDNESLGLEKLEALKSLEYLH